VDLDWIADVVAPMSEDPKIIIRVIIFELTQHIRARYLNVTDRRTDGRTTYDSNTALALRASRGKNSSGVFFDSRCTKAQKNVKGRSSNTDKNVNVYCVVSSALGTCRGNIVEEITSSHLLTSGYYWLFDNPYKPTGTSRSTTIIRSRPHFQDQD